MATCKSCLEWRKGKVFRPLLANRFSIGNEVFSISKRYALRLMWKCGNVKMWKWLKFEITYA